MLTLADVRTDPDILSVAQVDPATQLFTDRINGACRRLLNRGNWYATMQKVGIAGLGNLIVWPTDVATPLAVNHAGEALALRNGWYEFLQLDQSDLCEVARCRSSQSLLRSDVTWTYISPACVVHNIPAGTPKYVTVALADAGDAGEILFIEGTDSYGQTASESLTVNAPTVTSTRSYTSIRRVIKSVTTGALALYYADDTLNTNPVWMATYGPSETRPEYRVSVVNSCGVSSTDTETVHYYTALVKLKHVNAVAGTDQLSIGNVDAIKLALLSIMKENASDPQGAEVEIMRAVHELNLELNNMLPDYQTPIEYDPVGGLDLGPHRAF